MWNNLRLFDTELFSAVNNLPHNTIFDTFFLFFSGIGLWGIVWLIIWASIIAYKFGEEIIEDFALFLSGIFTFLFVSLGIKNFIHRPRPEFQLLNTNVIIDRAASWSFPSTHTTLAFAAAYILSKGHKRFRAVFYLCAFLVAFSRVYLGKHFPSDVIFGAIAGTLIGVLSYHLSLKIFRKKKSSRQTSL